MDAIYMLSPQPHIIECLFADFERRRYRRSFIIWTGPVPDPLQRRIDGARRQIAGMLLVCVAPNGIVGGTSYAHYHSVGPPELLFVDFYPRESHLVTFRDPSSFLVLYNPSCNDLVARHLKTLASKVRVPRSVLRMRCDRLTEASPRSPLYASPSKSFPRFGTTNHQSIQSTKRGFCACIWPVSFSKN